LPDEPHNKYFDARTLSGVALALILVSSFLLKLHHLDHAAIKGLDESFHAVVARNLLKHPLTPTLIDQPYLPYNYRDWQLNHVWLHKPIVPLWQMAASLALFGINTLALRLPSALLATASVWLTYAIGKRLLGRGPALIAAALQAFNPGLVSLVQGYVFSDHVDVAFLFWVELSIFFLIRALRTGRALDLAACGFAQGVAFLCKTYPAFIVTGIAVAAWLLPTIRLTVDSTIKLRPRHILILLLATVLTIAPWTIYGYLHFRPEFVWEQAQVFRHLGANVEGWAAPWDRLVFDFSLRIYGLFYPCVLVAAIVLLPRAWKQRNANLWLTYAWALGVLIPHVIATSKTPTATLIGWPPFLLLFGEMVRRAVRGDAWSLGAWLTATLLATLWPGAIPQSGWGYPTPPIFATIFRQNIWVLWHILIALAAACAFAALFRNRPHPRLIGTATLIAACFTLFLFSRTTYTAWKITNVNDNQPTYSQLATLVEHNLPKSAVLLFDQREKLEYTMAMFWIDRTAYPLGRDNWNTLTSAIRARGGVPLIVSPRPLPLVPLFSADRDGLIIYDPKHADLSHLSAIYPTDISLPR